MRENDIVTIRGRKYKIAHIHSSFGYVTYYLLDDVNDQSDEGRVIVYKQDLEELLKGSELETNLTK